MEIKQREKILVIGAIVCFSVLLGDKIIFTPLAHLWEKRSARITELSKSLNDADFLLKRESSINEMWSDMRKRAIPTEVSAAEDRVLKAVDRWSEESDLKPESIKPRWYRPEDDFARLEVGTVTVGSMSAITRFLYELEKDPMAARVEQIDVTPRSDTGEKLALNMRFSVIALKDAIADSSADAKIEDSSSIPDFKSFSLISDRNIFDPKRRPLRLEEKSIEPTETPVPRENITLTGVLVKPGESVAFFEGSDIGGSEAVLTGKKIGGCRITDIRSDAVDVKRDGEKLTLPVGWSLSRRGEEKWDVVEEAELPESSKTESVSDATGEVKDASGEKSDSEKPKGGADDDVLKRLMERRNKELGK